MDKDEALKMAIEGYEQCLDDLQGWAAYASEYFQDKWDLEGEVKDHRDKIQSCKEALEQPAQEYDINKMIDNITPENLQKPVAEVTSKTGADITMSWWHEPALPVGTKLYTHHAQPLSDDEIHGIIEKWDYLWAGDDISVWHNFLSRLIRIVENHHGIGVKDE